MFSFEKRTHFAAVAHLVERHLAKVEVASSSLVGRSTNNKIPASCRYFVYMVTWPSGKARVCKTLIHQFKSGRHLQKKWSFWITATFLLLQNPFVQINKRSTALFTWGLPRWNILGAVGKTGIFTDRRRDFSMYAMYATNWERPAGSCQGAVAGLLSPAGRPAGRTGKDSRSRAAGRQAAGYAGAATL